MSETKLKPCPFCGRKVKLNVYTVGDSIQDEYIIECGGKDCFCTMDHYNKNNLIKSWNFRPKSCALYTDYKKSCQSLKDHESQKGNLQRVSDCIIYDKCRYRDLTDCGDNCRHRS